MSLSNDFMEGKVLAHTFDRIFHREELTPMVNAELRQNIELIEQMCDGMGFCLSEDGDLLSQWRGYAADGTGFSIGFARAYLEELASLSRPPEEYIKLHQVVYDPDDQEATVMPIYDEVRAEIAAGKLNAPKLPALGEILIGTLTQADALATYERQRQEYADARRATALKMYESYRSQYTLKGSAFSEEREWRLLSLLFKDEKYMCSYRAAGDRVVPYLELNLAPLEMPQILEVILGPKNRTPVYVVEKMLEQHGFHAVRVRSSKATYR